MRVFTAISLPDEIRGRIAALARALPGPVAAVAKDNLHITLHFFGERRASETESIIGALGAVHQERYEADVCGVSAFGGRTPKVVFAKVSDGGRTAQLYRFISKRLGNAGIVGEEGRDYVPHVTIARTLRTSPSSAINGFVAAHSLTEFGRFTVCSVLVMKSTLTSAGPTYETLFEHKL